MRLSYGEKAAIRLLRDPRTSARRMVIIMDALAAREEVRMTHLLYVVARWERMTHRLLPA